jgi:hypothetical protein
MTGCAGNVIPRAAPPVAMCRLSLVVGVLAVVILSAPTAAHAQRPTFASTLFWDSGLINVPAAYASPLGGDLAFNFSRVSLDSANLPSLQAKQASYTLSLTASLWGRGEVGISVFSGDLKSGLFGKFVILDQTDGIWRRGPAHWMPSLAVGVRNVGTEKSLNRLALSGTESFSTAPTVYGVATRTFVVRPADDRDPTRPRTQLSLSAGYGTGLFKDDGGLGKQYASSATGGLFGGASFDISTGKYSSVSILAEQDGWGVNAGARADVRGLRIALFATELGAGTAKATASSAPGNPVVATGGYSSQKIAMSVGWQANVLTLVRGNRMDQTTAKLTQAQGNLQREARFSQQRIDVLEGQIDALRAVASQEKFAERAELERRLRDEQEALRRLQILIKTREAAKKP